MTVKTIRFPANPRIVLDFGNLKTGLLTIGKSKPVEVNTLREPVNKTRLNIKFPDSGQTKPICEIRPDDRQEPRSYTGGLLGRFGEDHSKTWVLTGIFTKHNMFIGGSGREAQTLFGTWHKLDVPYDSLKQFAAEADHLGMDFVFTASESGLKSISDRYSASSIPKPKVA